MIKLTGELKGMVQEMKAQWLKEAQANFLEELIARRMRLTLEQSPDMEAHDRWEAEVYKAHLAYVEALNKA